MDSIVIEQLKKEWTGQNVTVSDSNPRHARFAARIGTVITVNMNGLALVQFNDDVDIGRYDIPLAALSKSSGDIARNRAPVKPETPPAQEPKLSAAPDMKPPQKKTGMSILELARQQGAAK